MFLTLLVSAFTPLSFAQSAAGPWKFDLTSPPPAFSSETGHGLEPGGTPDLFKFSVVVDPGNYRVTVKLGNATAESTTTVKAEARRLMLEQVHTQAGEFVSRAFTVNVRTPAMPPGNSLKLNPREWNPATNEAVTATWDTKLTLQFSGDRPAVAAIEIERVADAITVFLIGDSTVTDQPSEPYGTWGQLLPRWFGPAVAVANHAESGETLKAFRAQRRWEKVMGEMKAGDYVFLQFGHNDLNTKGHDGIWPREDTAGDWVNTHAEANTDYQWLLAAYAVEVKRRGGIPVIVSPMTKVNIRTGELNVAGLGDYPKAAAAAARMADVAFIDLNAMSVTLAQALGPQLAPKAYVDGLHSNTYGAYLFARCVVEGIKQAKLGLVQHLVEDAAAFDPAHPQPLPDDFRLPLEPRPPRPPRPPAAPAPAVLPGSSPP
ncbi:MAG TPA: rhamnogalacturonan acetylesterase [Lacunisphaera sp.]|nr:rhamnogalacturonan acetylesterase [Lacunisphaera sp.]